MPTEMITLKLDNAFLKEIDGVVKSRNYQNRTEFIRAALRAKVDEAKLQQAMFEIGKLRGAGKRAVQTTDEEIHEARERAFEELGKRFK